MAPPATDSAAAAASSTLGEGPIPEGPPLPPPAGLPPIAIQRRAAPLGPQKRQQKSETQSIQVIGGRIVYYGSTGNFEAQCASGHGRCTWSCKKRAANVEMREVAEFSPVGMLASWLGYGPQCGTKEEHKEQDILKLLRERPDFAMNGCRQVETVLGGPEFLAFEKD